MLVRSIMLLATLRFLAGGMMWDMCLALDIGFGSYRGEGGVTWPTIYALDCLTDYEIGLPSNEESEMKNSLACVPTPLNNFGVERWNTISKVQ